MKHCYRLRRIRFFLTKNGFDVQNYDFRNKEVNTRLSDALRLKKKAEQNFRLECGIGFGLVALGSAISIASLTKARKNINNGNDPPENLGKALVFGTLLNAAGGLTIAISSISGLTNNTRAKHKVKEAIRLKKLP